MKEPPVPQKNDAFNALINVEQHPEVVVVRIKAEKIEEYNVQEVQDAMSLAIAEVSPKPVVLELSGVIFLQSLALGALLRILTECRTREQPLFLVGLNSDLKELFRVTRLNQVFRIVADVPAVIELLRVL
ncbi:MAG: anti-sigma factor antagonist [Planctomycetota bacterium]|jgi:anti-anti-sigma factor|nr:MAG: anti-sigma factor antagonist [Planctomycetota bacterium]RLS58406.1 MAG: anti-sigma factor antagonist [Planctomycetota bacterium]